MTFSHEMRGLGFEPRKALSYWSLNPTRLTAPASPHEQLDKGWSLKVLIFEDLRLSIFNSLANKNLFFW